MLRTRVIPCLLLRGGGLVKSLRFRAPKYVGDPINAIRIFNEKEVDELIVLDINASKAHQPPDYALVERFAGECFMPLCYGGGVRSVDDARKLFALGVEKVSIQTAAIEGPSVIERIAKAFGSQSVVASIDVKRNWRRKPMLYHAATGQTLERPWLEHLRNLTSAGAGEIMLNAVHCDGTMKGTDLDIIAEACGSVSVPVIAVGGVGSLQDIRATADVGASAVGVGAYFVFQGPHRAVLISYPKYSDLQDLLAR